MRHLVESAFTATILTLLFAPASSFAQAPAARKAWTPPRTPDGQPDLQGVWTNNTVTPLERPKGLGAKEFYNESELAAAIEKERKRLGQAEEEGRGTEPGTAADVHYDFSQFGLDRAQANLAWNRRTSIIVGPEALKRRAERRARVKGHEFDGAESLSLSARCIARPNVGPPLLPAAYNSNLQIVQAAGYVVIESEMIHDARMIPTDGRPHLDKNIKQWMGDSVGHWEGNTLVVDTTNFTDKVLYRSAAENLHLVERFTRVGPGDIDYRVTITDPTTFTRPWTLAIPFVNTGEEMFEYACHEGNYGMAGILSGARQAERAAEGTGR
jgi:hypothetical protein